MRSHQKGHMNVYYIEKKESKKRFPKLIVLGLKKKKKSHKLGMSKRCHAFIFIIGIYKYVHGDMYTSFYSHTWYFSIHVQ